MAHRTSIRAIQAAQRRQERAAQSHLRDLERQAKEQAKLSAIEQARLEVETFENRIEVLLSVHKEQGEAWDWIGLSASLPPPSPHRHSRHEHRAKQGAEVLPASLKPDAENQIQQARLRDDAEFLQLEQVYSEQLTEWEKLKSLARRILAGDPKAFTEALTEMNPFLEISDLGSSMHFTVHTPRLMECVLKVNATQAIPADVKSLTSTGKVSVKPMPKGRFHEIYQDYVCGCAMRVARELFALFPVSTVLVTASVDVPDAHGGQATEQPVLSAVFTRAKFEELDFSKLDPSDSTDIFPHRGDFTASRKSQIFQRITPLTPEDIFEATNGEPGYSETLSRARKLKEVLKAEADQLGQNAVAPAPPINTMP